MIENCSILRLNSRSMINHEFHINSRGLILKTPDKAEKSDKPKEPQEPMTPAPDKEPKELQEPMAPAPDEAKTVNELNEALTAPHPVRISNQILQMFGCKRDSELKDHEIIDIALDRFACSADIYQEVWNNGQPKAKFAVFYKLDERSDMEVMYSNVLFEIINEFTSWVEGRQKVPTLEEINGFFETMYQEVLALGKLSGTKGKIKVELIQYILAADNLVLLKTKEKKEINHWFDVIKRSETIKIMGDARLFQMTREQCIQAFSTGCIYKPDPALHNWGMNACWALAITRAGLPIRVVSDINLDAFERTDPDPEEQLNPSAYCLEIVIAILMGYGLNIIQGHITLTPPEIPHDYHTNAVPGNGPIPTKEEQLHIFRRCVYAKDLHDHLRLSRENLREYVKTVCAEQHPLSDQLHFIWGLFYLFRGNSLTVILEALLETQLKRFNELLSDEQYNEPTLMPFKRLIYQYYLSHTLLSMAKPEQDEKKLQEFVHEKSGIADNQQKTNLVEGLRILAEKGDFMSVVQRLNVDNLHQLNRLLSKEFPDRSYHILSMQTRRELSSRYQNLVQGLAQKQNELDPKVLVGRLNMMLVGQELDQILGFFNRAVLNLLLSILAKPPFTESRFRNLDLRVRTYQETAFIMENVQNIPLINNRMETICAKENKDKKDGKDVVEVRILANAFLLMSEPYRLQVLNDLSDRAREALFKKLSEPSFNGEEYQTLIHILQFRTVKISGVKLGEGSRLNQQLAAAGGARETSLIFLLQNPQATPAPYRPKNRIPGKNP